MKPRKTTYNSLSGCLEPYFGEKRSLRSIPPREYREPEQGFHTVLFKSRPLQLNYMRDRAPRSMLRLPFGK